ncbi:uncharacterized protein PRCAT00002292001 [Priceomyces carsonii]|uniref:uncharacterized protein n=1 Tax=Priceomyces carsonii TaxID=28549 RepID=UPI002EDB8942|nr:unnamed protein product [Priceomyces carsonii]
MNSDASCGPSSALSNLSKYTDRDQTLQKEFVNSHPGTFHKTQGFKSNEGIDRRLNNDFQSFNNGGYHEFPSQMVNQFNRPPALNQPRPTMVGTPSHGGWVQDFSDLSLDSGAQHASRNFHQQQQMSEGWHQQFLNQQSQNRQAQLLSQPQDLQNRHMQNVNSSFSSAYPLNMRTNLSTPLIPQMLSMTEHQEIHKLDYESTNFESHFDQVEKELLEAEKEQQQHHEEITTENDKEEFARAAQKVQSSMLSSNTSAETSNKFQNSNFLKLMNSISNRAVELEGDKLVDSQSREDIRDQTHDLQQELLDHLVSAQENQTMKVNSLNSHHNTVEQPYQNSTAASGRQQWREENINHLPDPLAHIRDGDLAHISNPLQAAKIISGDQVKNRDWMEDESWFQKRDSRSPLQNERNSILADEWQEMYDDYRHDDD